ncbi:MAG: thioredoxin family protein [Spirochaetales bacterium]|uniref:Thioredoxin family protein n=1 Tax=Candidatus Thalassospirochaeta sargassi TaxID=3119039 RepID=A0AAJ1MLH4_9SPIO|nr:thioredoxin family protein [Spirochaetales bacterium]
MKKKMRKIVLLMIVILILTGLATACARGTADSEQPETLDVKSSGPESEKMVTESAEQTDSALEVDYPPEGWVTDIREAYSLAQAGDKQILVNFTGSDWCVWCRKLSSQVFTTPEFRSYAEDNLVLLFLDFPNGISLPDEQVMHNQIIAQLLGVQGYPSIWLLDSDLSPLLATGFREGGPESYIAHLENDRPEITAEDRENFRMGFTTAIEQNIGALN